MQDYHNRLQKNVHGHTSFSKKWRSKISRQSPLSSYHTTKRAQLDTIQSFDTLALLLQTRCDGTQQVIDTYKEQVKKMYPSKRLSTVHKHYQSDIMEESFKTAYSPLSELLDKLGKLHEQEARTKDALNKANIQCENLSLDQTASKNKLTLAHEKQKKKKDELEEIIAEISQTEEEYNEEQEIYYGKAMEIYNRCRRLEEERLDLIRQTLINFIQVVHTSEYAAEHDAIFQNLLTNIENQQDTIEDLNFWARTYHVYTLKTTTDDDNITESQTTVQEIEESHNLEPENDTTTNESITEDDTDNTK
jgi:chromosome segregation ATPase